MKKKGIRTLDQLYEYYANSSKRSRHFSASEEEDGIIVEVPGAITFEQDNSEDMTKFGLTPVHLKACHTGLNLNRSNISDETMTDALPSFANRPILAYIHEVDGQLEFYDHRRHIEDDNMEYDESPVGIVPETNNAQLVYDEDSEKNYVQADGYIYDIYSHAKEILERDGECACSIEIDIKEATYDAKNDILNIEKFTFNGITLLGKTPSGHEVLPGMENANVKLSDFVGQSAFSNDKVIAMLNDIYAKIDQLTINQNKQEGGQPEMDKLKELLQKYEAKVEDLTFAYEGLTDEELEAAFAKQFEASSTAPSNTPEQTPEEEKFTKSFELSHDDIRVGLYHLLSALESADNQWYWISDVYDEYFVYEGDNEHIFKQSYKVNGDVVEFEGDRIHLNREYLTDDELKSLNEMRSNYEEIKAKLSKYEAEPSKMEILDSQNYSIIAEKEEFVALKAVEGHFDLSVEEVKAKANEILLSYAMQLGNSTEEFAAQPKNASNQPTMIPVPTTTAKKVSKYGGLGKKD